MGHTDIVCLLIWCTEKVVLILFPLDIYPVMGLLNHTVVLCFIFWGNSMLFSTMAVQIIFPPEYTGVPFLHSFANTCSLVFFDDSHPNRWSLVSFFCVWVSSFPSTFFPRDFAFPHYVYLESLSKISWPYIHRFISGLSILFHRSLHILWWFLLHYL